jgi:hypothetical protein
MLPQATHLRDIGRGVGRVVDGGEGEEERRAMDCAGSRELHNVSYGPPYPINFTLSYLQPTKYNEERENEIENEIEPLDVGFQQLKKGRYHLLAYTGYNSPTPRWGARPPNTLRFCSAKALWKNDRIGCRRQFGL